MRRTRLRLAAFLIAACAVAACGSGGSDLLIQAGSPTPSSAAAIEPTRTPTASPSAAASPPATSTPGTPAVSNPPAPTQVPAAPAPSATPEPVATTPPTAPTPPPGTRFELAPIEHIEVRTAQSSPAQYFVDITSGLPNGCARYDHIDVSSSGSTFTLTVWNTLPSEPRTACTAIYGYVTHAIALGALTSGRYTLHVNDKQQSFTAQ